MINFKKNDVVKIWNNKIKLITRISFVNGNILVIFSPDYYYDLNTGTVKFDEEYNGCKIRKVVGKVLIIQRYRELLEKYKISTNISLIEFIKKKVSIWKEAKKYYKLKEPCIYIKTKEFYSVSS